GGAGGGAAEVGQAGQRALDHLEQRLVGAGAFARAPLDDGGAAALEAAGELGEQAALADAGGAGDQRDAAAAGRQDLLVQRLERGELAIAADAAREASPTLDITEGDPRFGIGGGAANFHSLPFAPHPTWTGG